MFEEYINPCGLIHVGAHGGGEYYHYVGLGIKHLVFFEPQHYWFEKLIEHQQEVRANSNRSLENDRCVNAALGNFNGETKMHVASNNGASSSLLLPGTHASQYPEITFTQTETVQVMRLDDYWNTDGQSPENFDTIVLDTQGYELQVLLGAIETLPNIDVLQIEVERVELYKTAAHIDEIDVFLAAKGFQRRFVSWSGGSWGDAVYKRIGVAVVDESFIDNLQYLTRVGDCRWDLKRPKGVVIHVILQNGTGLVQIEDRDTTIVHEQLTLTNAELEATTRTLAAACN